MTATAHRLKSILHLIRPHQYIKNLFVFAGILFAKHHWYLNNFLNAALIFSAFCLISSAVYILNDMIDCEQDRNHPKKCHRPLASGAISLNFAKILLLLFIILSSILAYCVSLDGLLLVIFYFVLNIGYSTILKKIVILDIFCISMGFMCRILAGTWGLSIQPSDWLLLCGFMITVFLGFSKRYSEIKSLKEHDTQIGSTRAVLSLYNIPMLEHFMTISAACSLMCYGLYTVSPDTLLQHGDTNLIYTLPVVAYGIFRYLYLVYAQGGGHDTSYEIVHDPHMITTMLLWIGMIIWLLSCT